MPTPDLDRFLADALTAADHPEITDIAADPSGRPDAWCRVRATFADGSACYVNVEQAR